MIITFSDPAFPGVENSLVLLDYDVGKQEEVVLEVCRRSAEQFARMHADRLYKAGPKGKLP